MRTRRAVALFAFPLLLLFLLFAPNRPEELLRRVRRIRRGAEIPLALRRLEGSSAAFDRRFSYFLESARRRLPEGAAGVAVFLPSPSEAARDLATYQLAPLPVRLAPRQVPAGWILAVYGAWRPPGWRQIARVSDGVLLARAP